MDEGYTAKEVECIARLYSNYEKSISFRSRDYKIDFDTALQTLSADEKQLVWDFIEDCKGGFNGKANANLCSLFERMAKILSGEVNNDTYT